ncbi:hypothetical protein WISP_65807 [Willisornis vidua]|uniref:Uncharacterized protein n=1 Tax=Willisornis vidua TaxID=1566151 RepID=A0ABQ9DE51_9PASS|nr:hypothetical protein WISP_65807 [Willisornis vidua]
MWQKQVQKFQDTEDSEEEKDRRTIRDRAEIPLQPMEVHRGAEIHLQPVEEPHAEVGGCPKKDVTPWELHVVPAEEEADEATLVGTWSQPGSAQHREVKK